VSQKGFSRQAAKKVSREGAKKAKGREAAKGRLRASAREYLQMRFAQENGFASFALFATSRETFFAAYPTTVISRA
jgi:hypothetical protein